jgi:hypothetical protein
VRVGRVRVEARCVVLKPVSNVVVTLLYALYPVCRIVRPVLTVDWSIEVIVVSSTDEEEESQIGVTTLST